MVAAQRSCSSGSAPAVAPQVLLANASECAAKRVSATPLQAKLRIGAQNDEYEREADQVAGQVMRMDSTEHVHTASSRAEPLVRRRVSTSAPGTGQAVPQIVHEVLSSQGRPLDASTRAFFEPRFGHDFSRVQIHADARAAESARAINAQAYTAGRHIVMGCGEHPPRQLLAHELTHVVQQDDQSEGADRIRRSVAPDGVPAMLASAMEAAARAAVGTLGALDKATLATAIERALRLPGVDSFILSHPAMVPYRGALEFARSTPGAIEAVWDFIQNPKPYQERIQASLEPYIADAQRIAYEQGDGFLAQLGVPEQHRATVWKVLKTVAGFAQSAFGFVINDIILDTVLFWQLRSEHQIYDEAWKRYQEGSIDSLDLILEYLSIVLNVIGRLEDLMPLFLTAAGLVTGGAAGGTAGSVAPGAGTAVGGGAGGGTGATVGVAASEILGLVAQIGPAALEWDKAVKATIDLTFREQNEQQRQQDYGQIAASAVGLIVMGVLAFVPGFALRTGKAMGRKLRELVPNVSAIVPEVAVRIPASAEKAPLEAPAPTPVEAAAPTSVDAPGSTSVETPAPDAPEIRARLPDTIAELQSAASAGDADTARRVFTDIQQSLPAEESDVIWRDMVGSAARLNWLSVPVTLSEAPHTLKFILDRGDAFCEVCTWCEPVRKLLEAGRTRLAKGTDPNATTRVVQLEGQLSQIETSLARGSEWQAEAYKRRRVVTALLNVLTEAEALGVSPTDTAVKKARKETGRHLDVLSAKTVDFMSLADDPRVGARAAVLYPNLLREIWNRRAGFFPQINSLPEVRADFELGILEEAKGRALTQALNETLQSEGRSLSTQPLTGPARQFNPAIDIPYGFLDQSAFATFALNLRTEVTKLDGAARVFLVGSSLPGRRFERVIGTGHVGKPFDLGPLSDYDVSIVSQPLFEVASRIGVPDIGPLKPSHIEALHLTSLDEVAKQKVKETTGLAHEVHFKIYRDVPSDPVIELR